MTKAELLADLATLYKSLGTPIDQGTTVNGVHQFIVYVFEEGLSEGSKKPTGCQKQITFYVYNEGLGDEKAYYELTEPVNTSNTDVTISTSSYLAIANLYNSTILQQRTLAAVMACCTAIFFEDTGTTNHANRMKLVSAANQNLYLVVMQFMSTVAQNATVQAQGTSVDDSCSSNYYFWFLGFVRQLISCLRRDK